MTRARPLGAQPPQNREAAAPALDAPLPIRRPGAHLPAGATAGRYARLRRWPGARRGRTLRYVARRDSATGDHLAPLAADATDDAILMRIRAALETMP